MRQRGPRVLACVSLRRSCSPLPGCGGAPSGARFDLGQPRRPCEGTPWGCRDSDRRCRHRQLSPNRRSASCLWSGRDPLAHILEISSLNISGCLIRLPLSMRWPVHFVASSRSLRCSDSSGCIGSPLVGRFCRCQDYLQKIQTDRQTLRMVRLVVLCRY